MGIGPPSSALLCYVVRFEAVGVTDSRRVRLLTVLLETVAPADVPLFWASVGHFADLDACLEQLSLLMWAVYFPPPHLDTTALAICVFAVMTAMADVSDPAPVRLRCGGATKFHPDAQEPFGWRYRSI